MAAAEKLYTPELLGLAVELADYPLADHLPLRGSARSRSCGSTLDMALSLDDTGCIVGVGMQVRACAVGQAAAAIFARGAPATKPDKIRAARDAIAAWLESGGDLPDWPDLATLAAAREFPGRHGAILLPWNAAAQALCSASPAR